jgi:cell fate regulator YaaT (PSP1 superfamily)
MTETGMTMDNSDITTPMMRIVGVRFRENWKVYDFDASDTAVAIGDRVIVDSDRGPGLAFVVRIKHQPKPAQPEPEQMVQGLQVESDEPGVEAPAASQPRTLRKILRKATEEDLSRQQKNEEREAEGFRVAQEVITERELPMKLIRVEYSFDASRATFNFFSETRVDFRDLVKDLAFKLKARIEMRQIGVRDVARLIGGFGPCGRELCCASFLKNFEPVSIRMAKKQDMVLNPAKISGVCGRLLCCLSYEFEMYEGNKKDLAQMREAANREKVEKKEQEERILAEERKATDVRLASEKRQQDQRRPQKPGRDRQKEKEQQPSQQKREGGQQERKQGQQQKPSQQKQEKKPQQQQQPHQPRPDRKPQVQQGKPVQADQPEKTEQQEGEASAKKKRRRFWRKKKKGGQPGQPGGDNKPQGPPAAG